MTPGKQTRWSWLSRVDPLDWLGRIDPLAYLGRVDPLAYLGRLAWRPARIRPDDRGAHTSEASSHTEAPAPEAGPRRLGRRQFLQRAALGGVGVTALGALGGALEAFSTASESSVPPRKAKHQWGMVIDLRACDGCERCTAACQSAHYLHEDQTWIKVFTMRSASGGRYFMPRPCMMCEDPPCVPVCPVKANIRTDEGLTLVDQGRCIGTRICMNACPYQARYFNWGEALPAPRQPFPQEPAWPVPQVKGTVGKCVFCAAMLPVGKVPECVSHCPMGVLYLADLATDVAVNGLGDAVKLSTFLAENDAVTFKESYGTHPRVYYILGHDQNLESDPNGG